ncbi:hypothetical protein C3489_12810 [Streptomyces sp. Ru71]|uniref:hypothetical protein n=1 Tax=Streptomyces sp. Ru71 TaxID=2080746 RepID=UPI000CDE3847|nr:hypothetical protein [Streptomyces sp. Ru71]POX54766.1 hypothetical protein C3489_12810 [Streptomyces sp. Ru71]
MRMRSVLAAALLTVTLTAAGAATAAAANHDPRHGVDDGTDVCAAYYGGITSEGGNLAWGGSFCRGDLGD